MSQNKKRYEKLNVLLTAAVVVSLAAVVFFTAYRFDNKYTSDGPKAQNGVLLLDEKTQKDFPSFFLVDGWEYYGGRLLSPEDFLQSPPAPDQYIFIGRYGGFEAGDKNASPHGSASYRLTIKVPEEKRTYLLELPEIFSAYRLYVNGKQAAAMGDPDPASYCPETGNRTISIEAGGSIELLLAVTDYSHLYSGMVYPPAFGQPKAVSDLLSARLTFRSVVCAIALTVGLLSVLIGLLSRKNPSALLYGLLCLLFIGYVCYPITRTFFAGYAPGYAIENFSFCAMLAVVMLLMKRVCALKSKWSAPFILFGVFMCLVSIALPFLIRGGNLTVMMAYSTLVSIYEWSSAAFITIAATRAVLRNTVHTKTLLYGILIFDCGLVMDRLLPLHEPIVTGWFIEIASFTLVLFIGIIIAQEVAERYRNAAVLTERTSSMERLYTTQQTYFEVLKQEMDATKKLRHDMRHHFTMIDGFAQNRQYEELSAYVSEYRAAFGEHEPIHYCPINVINVLAFHYDTLSEQNHIHFDLRCEIRADEGKEGFVDMSDADLCSLFSNLMENAVEACLRIRTGRRYIRATIVRVAEGHLLIRVKNSTDGNVRQDGDTFLSSKTEDRKGYGLSSIISIAQKYGGSASFRWNQAERMFESKVILRV